MCLRQLVSFQTSTLGPSWGAENHLQVVPTRSLLPCRPPGQPGLSRDFLWLTRHLREEAQRTHPGPGCQWPRSLSGPTTESPVCSCSSCLQTHSGIKGAWGRVGGQAETLLESALFINFGIPQASVFSSLLTLGAHPGGGGCDPHTHRLQMQKPGHSFPGGGRDEASSHQQPQSPHGEKLTFREQIVAGHTEARTRDSAGLWSGLRRRKCSSERFRN